MQAVTEAPKAAIMVISEAEGLAKAEDLWKDCQE